MRNIALSFPSRLPAKQKNRQKYKIKYIVSGHQHLENSYISGRQFGFIHRLKGKDRNCLLTVGSCAAKSCLNSIQFNDKDTAAPLPTDSQTSLSLFQG